MKGFSSSLAAYTFLDAISWFQEAEEVVIPNYNTMTATVAITRETMYRLMQKIEGGFKSTLIPNSTLSKTRVHVEKLIPFIPSEFWEAMQKRSAKYRDISQKLLETMEIKTEPIIPIPVPQ